MVSLPSVDVYRCVAGGLYLAVEVCFAIGFRSYMIPRANRLTKAAEYRDYGQDKRKLMLRIMHRIEETCRITKGDESNTMKTFLTEWFHVERKAPHDTEPSSSKGVPSMTSTDNTTNLAPDLSLTPSSSPENSDDDNSESSPATPEDIAIDDIILYRQDTDDFFAWAFWGKHYSAMDEEDVLELDRIYQELQDRHNLTFPERNDTTDDSDTHHSKPRLMTLEPVNAWYRPLCVYLTVYLIKILGGIILRLMGFQRTVACTGLVAWYRPALFQSSKVETSLLPMLFFHGIAPGGVMLYLPMIFFGLATEPERPVLLFENRSISCALVFHPLTEEETVQGVVEVLEAKQLQHSDLSLVGHSFGSCSMTWLLASRRLPNIKQVVLIDPVAVLLSEPDVMVNFLYAEELDKIRMVASSELFTEYYLRRHFAWYNSEMWLEDYVDDCKVLVCLSEKDEIINPKKVKQEIERHAQSARLVYWEGVGHGASIPSPSKWKQVKRIMLEQELQIAQEKRQ
jgi:pimeloyl-ACP methyl ester carboxylesterase